MSVSRRRHPRVPTEASCHLRARVDRGLSDKLLACETTTVALGGVGLRLSPDFADAFPPIVSGDEMSLCLRASSFTLELPIRVAWTKGSEENGESRLIAVEIGERQTLGPYVELYRQWVDEEWSRFRASVVEREADIAEQHGLSPETLQRVMETHALAGGLVEDLISFLRKVAPHQFAQLR